MKRMEWLRETRMWRFEKALEAWTEASADAGGGAAARGVCADVPALRGPLRGVGVDGVVDKWVSKVSAGAEQLDMAGTRSVAGAG